MNKQSIINTTVIKVTIINETIRLLTLSTDTSVNFTPGQFVMFSANINGEKIDRSYSIASSPLPQPKRNVVQPHSLEFVIRLEPQGKMSEYITNLSVKDTLAIKGPFGRFGQCNIQNPTELIFIAGGVGIAPIRSMILHYSKLQTPHPILSLFYGFRNPQEYLFRSEFESLHTSGHLSQLVPSISENDPTWSGACGHIDLHVKKSLKHDQSHAIFICGPPPMVDSVKNSLAELGYSRKQIHLEAW